MLRKSSVDVSNIEIPQTWICKRLGLTPSESKLFLTAIETFKNSSFTPREIAEAGCAVNSSMYASLYNKNVFNKNEDKTWSINIPFINKVGKEYQDSQIKGHSIILHFLFGGFALYIPTVYFLCSKKHYFHI